MSAGWDMGEFGGAVGGWSGRVAGGCAGADILGSLIGRVAGSRDEASFETLFRHCASRFKAWGVRNAMAAAAAH